MIEASKNFISLWIPDSLFHIISGFGGRNAEKCEGTSFGTYRLGEYSNHLIVYKWFHSNTVKVLRVNHFDSHFCLAQRNNQHFKMSAWLFYHCLNNAYGAYGMPAYIPFKINICTHVILYCIYKKCSLTLVSIFNMLNMLNI